MRRPVPFSARHLLLLAALLVLSQGTQVRARPQEPHGVRRHFPHSEVPVAPGDAFTELISAAPDGSPGQRGTGGSAPSLSADGRYDAFVSEANNFATVLSGASNVFVRDRVSGTVELVSQSTSGAPGDEPSDTPVISADGRFVVFNSEARNLTSDNLRCGGVFIRDRTNGTTQLVKDNYVDTNFQGIVTCDGDYPLAISSDARYVVVNSYNTKLVPGDTNSAADVFVIDRQLQSTERVSVSSAGVQANGASGGAAISADGRYVAFSSYAGNLVTGDTNGASDVFVRDRMLGTTTRVSLTSNGGEPNGDSSAPVLTPDGRYVLFFSKATNLVSGFGAGYYLRDLQNNTTECVNLASDGSQPADQFYEPRSTPAISSDGRYVAFGSAENDIVPGDTGYLADVFVRDRVAHTTQVVSVPAGGGPSSGSNERITLDLTIAMSSDGRYVAFDSDRTNLVPGDTNGALDVFVRDRQAGTTSRVSVGAGGQEGIAEEDCFGVSITPDGRYVAFASDANNLVPGDTNGFTDVFVRDRKTGTTQLVSHGVGGAPANGPSVYNPQNYPGDHDQHSRTQISADGRIVVFNSRARNLVQGVFSAPSVYAYDRTAGTTELVSVSPTGQQMVVANDPSMTADGRYVAFETFGALYVRDRQSKTTEQLTGVTQAMEPVLSADGRYVVFSSTASNIVSGDTNNQRDVFVYDRTTKTSQRVSIAGFTTQGTNASGIPESSVSSDGNLIVFHSLADNLDGPGSGYFLRDRNAAKTTRLSYTPEGGSFNPWVEEAPVISADGSTAAFLGPQVVNTYLSRVLIRNLGTGVMEELPAPAAAVTMNATARNRVALSQDGRYVAFRYAPRNFAPSYASGTSDVYLRDRGGPPVTPASLTASVVSARRIDLSWVPGAADASSYQITRADSPGTVFFPLATVDGSVTTYSDTTVQPKSTYQYQIVATNAFGSSSAVTSSSVTTPGEPPTAPAQPSATALLDTEIDLHWINTAADADDIRIERRSGSSPYAEIKTLVPATTQFADTTVHPGTTYYYHLRAHNSAGFSDYSDEVTATTPAAYAGVLSVGASLNVGSASVGGSAFHALVLKNTDKTATLKVTLGVITGPFRITGGQGVLLIGPRGSKSVTVEFHPTAVGPGKGTLALTSTDSRHASVTIKLQGAGKR